MIMPATGESLPVFLARYRRLIAYISGPLQETIAYFSGPSSLTSSAKSSILELKVGENKRGGFIVPVLNVRMLSNTN